MKETKHKMHLLRRMSCMLQLKNFQICMTCMVIYVYPDASFFFFFAYSITCVSCIMLCFMPRVLVQLSDEHVFWKHKEAMLLQQ